MSRANSGQSVQEHGKLCLCHRIVNKRIQSIEIAHWREPQLGTDRFLFTANILGSTFFKLQDRSIRIRELIFHGPKGICFLSMTVRPIVIHGDPVLHNPTEPVTETPAELAELIADMYETMDRAHGVGLAANQIGVGKRLFVYNCPDVEGPDGTMKTEAEIAEQGGEYRRGCVINPVLETSDIPETMPSDDGSEDEGCLSVPGESFPTGRANWARVTGTDEHGEPVSVEGYGFFARCLQHEVGHLDGFVYTDTLIGRWKRAAKKTIKANGWTEAGKTWTPGVDEDPFGYDD